MMIMVSVILLVIQLFQVLEIACVYAVIDEGTCPVIEATQEYGTYSIEEDRMLPNIAINDAATVIRELRIPVLIWWTGFTGVRGETRQCGNVQCYFTVNQAYQQHPHSKVFLFYGTDFKPWQLPLPREEDHIWALLHEESPKNQYLFSHKNVMSLFNYTSTFREASNFPIATQYLDDIEYLESKKYWMATQKKNILQADLAMVAYLQSDCDVPSDRDHLVQMMQRHVKIDSYGNCLHNKDLPKHLQDSTSTMYHKDLYTLLAQYKFILSLENAVCDSYITEKIWRPLMLGVVPIVYGAGNLKDYLPTNKSAVFVTDFANVEDLATHLNHLNENDEEYEKYLEHKYSGVSNEFVLNTVKQRTWGTDNNRKKTHFIEQYECHICEKAHQLSQPATNSATHADESHYGCPPPQRFSDEPPGNLTRVHDYLHASDWWFSKAQASVLRKFMAQNRTTFTQADVDKAAVNLMNTGEL